MSRQRQDPASDAHQERWFRTGAQALLADPNAAQQPRRATINVQAVVQAEIRADTGDVQAYSSFSFSFLPFLNFPLLGRFQTSLAVPCSQHKPAIPSFFLLPDALHLLHVLHLLSKLNLSRFLLKPRRPLSPLVSMTTTPWTSKTPTPKSTTQVTQLKLSNLRSMKLFLSVPLRTLVTGQLQGGAE